MWVGQTDHQNYMVLVCKTAGPPLEPAPRGNNRMLYLSNHHANRRKAAWIRRSEPAPRVHDDQSFLLWHPEAWRLQPSLPAGVPRAGTFRVGHAWPLKALVYLA